jgi:glutathione S-transferase
MMALIVYYMSGSPYAWRVRLALEHRGVAYDLKTVSYDAGDLNTPEYAALNPRRRVPVIVDDGFVLYESAAIVEYIADKWPGEPSLFASDLRLRAVQRRMVREVDQYFGAALEELVAAILFTPQAQWSDEKIFAARDAMKKELNAWESAIAGEYLADALSAVDFTMYPYIALVQRMGKRKSGLVTADFMGPKISAWVRRMETLPITQKTWPPHWK